MTSVDSNFNFLCGRPHAWAGPPPPFTCVRLNLTPLPHPCGRHKWMAPCLSDLRLILVCNTQNVSLQNTIYRVPDGLLFSISQSFSKAEIRILFTPPAFTTNLAQFVLQCMLSCRQPHYIGVDGKVLFYTSLAMRQKNKLSKKFAQSHGMRCM